MSSSPMSHWPNVPAASSAQFPATKKKDHNVSTYILPVLFLVATVCARDDSATPTETDTPGFVLDVRALQPTP